MGWHKLPPGSILHEWRWLLEIRRKFLIRLSPDEFADLKAHFDSTQLGKSSVQKDAFRPEEPDESKCGWWKPPNKNVFYFSLLDESGLYGDYYMEYDPKSQLLYLDDCF